MTDVSVIIVTWNSEEEIKPCINSIIAGVQATGGLDIELITVDNASSDNTLVEIRKTGFINLHILRNHENLGFTKAVNQALKSAQGKNILLLNPDTVLKQNVIPILNNFLNSNDAYGACAPLMLNVDGTIQPAIRNFPSYWSMYCEFYLFAYIFPKTKLFGKWKMKYFDYLNDSDVQQPMAAALMVKKSVLDKIGPMDERFEMFFNDVDLCKRIIDSGLRIRFIKAAEVIHKKGVSVYKNRAKMIRIWGNDCIEYFKKHHPNKILLLWLKINLKISEKFRILYIKLFR